MHILWNFQKNLKWSSWEIAESFFFKIKWPHCAVNNYIYYTKHESSGQLLLQIKIIVSELLFLMPEIMQLYHLSHTPILYGLENDRRNAKVFSISDYFNVTLWYILICIPNLVSYCKWFTNSVLINPLYDGGNAKYRRQTVR